MKINEWQKYPRMDHLEGSAKAIMEHRKRHKNIRYLLFRLKNDLDNGLTIRDPKKEDYNFLQTDLPGFINFWLMEKPLYLVSPTTVVNQFKKVGVPYSVKGKTVADLGGFKQFAIIWDVDADLNVYLRWSSVWQEWAATLMRVVPLLQEV